MVQSLQSMLLTSEQNGIMRLPNYGCFMHQQENLQALLVDIHEDPEGFKEFVETRRKGIRDLGDRLGEAMVSALTSGGKSLSDYINLTEIGKGRFSVVFYAECKTTRRPCAIKRIQLANPTAATKSSNIPSKGNSSDDKKNNGTSSSRAVVDGAGGRREGREKRRSRGAERRPPPPVGRPNTRGEMTYEQCLKEVGLLKNLASPNIVKLHTCFLDQNVLWLVMDWVDGGDLGGVLKRTKMEGGRLSEMTVWRYFTQICDALLHMHGERIIHRDLKPANVLVSRDGTVKLGDLGLGRYLNARSVLAMSQVGTPLYMSPETLKGQGHDMVSDIWSLGCVLYELAMLKSPFAGEHLTMKAVRAEE
ncbi:unnamed protein product [Hapterophycus canaliculatus]